MIYSSLRSEDAFVHHLQFLYGDLAVDSVKGWSSPFRGPGPGKVPADFLRARAVAQNDGATLSRRRWVPLHPLHVPVVEIVIVARSPLQHDVGKLGLSRNL